MSGESKRGGRQSRRGRNKNMESDERNEDSAPADEAMLAANNAAWQGGFLGLTKKIEELQQDIKTQFGTFKEEFKTEMKREFMTFKEEIDKKLFDNNKELRDQKEALEDAQTRIGDVEEWNTTAKEAMLVVLKEQRQLKEKLTDLESRSRRNNVRIFGVPEKYGKDSVPRFIESLLRKELELPAELDLGIQRAHRALTGKPNQGAPPRSIIVNFLQFSTKEMILRKAWEKRLKIDEKPVYFDHDYAFEVVQRRKAFGSIKKVLKENAIKFQTPLTNIRIHWPDGPVTYGNPEAAAREMRSRGYEVAVKATEQEDALEKRIREAFPWERTPTAEARRYTGFRARERLQEFRR